MEIVIIVLLAVCLLLLAAVLAVCLQNRGSGKELQRLKAELMEENRGNRREITAAVGDNIKSFSQLLSSQQETLRKTVNDMMLQNEQKLNFMQNTVDARLREMQKNNEGKLEQMRATVDEKLQKTLDERISRSFELVSKQLDMVSKGIGEMQSLAVGVGDLKKVLSNVKTRGILGEIQLGAILEEILSPEQYETNVVTKPGTRNPVEYAVKLPGDGETPVYLPIDAKFPSDAYAQLVDAYDGGSSEAIAAAGKILEQRMKGCAKDIHEKYVDPPYTTDFAILFLPFEGLYAEVVRRGLVETLQRDYKINIAGPTTMAALLNSLQMGFKTLAIQKHAGEVWNVLGAVKTEFDKFGSVLATTQQRLEQANQELDKLVGVRTRKINQKLRGVQRLTESDAAQYLNEAEDTEDDPQ